MEPYNYYRKYKTSLSHFQDCSCDYQYTDLPREKKLPLSRRRTFWVSEI